MAIGLIIEPDPDDRALIARCFRESGLRVAETACAIEGLSWIWNDSLAIVACDEILPDMNGYQVLQAMREHDECRRSTIFYSISSILTSHYENFPQKYQPNGVWKKPINHEIVFESLKIILQNS